MIKRNCKSRCWKLIGLEDRRDSYRKLNWVTETEKQQGKRSFLREARGPHIWERGQWWAESWALELSEVLRLEVSTASQFY